MSIFSILPSDSLFIHTNYRAVLAACCCVDRGVRVAYNTDARSAQANAHMERLVTLTHDWLSTEPHLTTAADMDIFSERQHGASDCLHVHRARAGSFLADELRGLR